MFHVHEQTFSHVFSAFHKGHRYRLFNRLVLFSFFCLTLKNNQSSVDVFSCSCWFVVKLILLFFDVSTLYGRFLFLFYISYSETYCCAMLHVHEQTFGHVYYVFHKGYRYITMFIIPVQLLIMSRPSLLITNLRPDLKVWKIAVRVIDLWVVKEHNGNQHVEAILQSVKVCFSMFPLFVFVFTCFTYCYILFLSH